MEMSGPYPPLHYLRMFSATDGRPVYRAFPESPPEYWWGQARSHLALAPGREAQARRAAPVEMRDLISSQVSQGLCMGHLQLDETCHVAHDNGVGSPALGVLNNYAAQSYAGSVDNLRSAGARLPSAGYEEAIQLSLTSLHDHETALFRWPAARSHEASASTRLVISPLTAAVAAAVAHEFGVAKLFDFLTDDYASISGPGLALYEFHSRETHMCCCPAQKTVALTALLAGSRLFSDQGSMRQQTLLTALPNELWLCVLSHMRLDELAPPPKAELRGRL